MILPQGLTSDHKECGLIYKELMTWVRSRRWACLVTWFCYHLIAKPGKRTGTPLWPDPYITTAKQSTTNPRVLWEILLIWLHLLGVHYDNTDIMWTSLCLKSWVTWLFFKHLVPPSNKKNGKTSQSHYWPFVRGIQQSLVDSHHKGPVM